MVCRWTQPLSIAGSILGWQITSSCIEATPSRHPHLLAGVLAHDEHAIGETLEVDQLLGLGQLLGVVLRGGSVEESVESGCMRRARHV